MKDPVHVFGSGRGFHLPNGLRALPTGREPCDLADLTIVQRRNVWAFPTSCYRRGASCPRGWKS